MLLAIDTATRYASIALHDEHTLRGECTWEANRQHTVTLLPHIYELLQETGITPEHLSAIAVCRGPGSYTGVRIGLAVAHEILHLNGGELELGRSESGGARITLWMPWQEN